MCVEARTRALIQEFKCRWLTDTRPRTECEIARFDYPRFSTRAFSCSMWHNGIMAKVKLPRCPYVPFDVLDFNNRSVFNLSGVFWGIVSREFAPTADESCEKLVALRTDLKWSRAMLGAFMGVSTGTLRRWETKERKPNGAARRLIWLMETLTRHPERLKNGLDMPFWGQTAENREFDRKHSTSVPENATKPPPAPAKKPRRRKSSTRER